ncbi:unnamed protein product [Ilex paraguariensis]|uniref:Uncharacterized protein n=1 Tax=Ilex paraguariensis TaxID=185542 RepID=A0ABC8R478_9AQUA
MESCASGTRSNAPCDYRSKVNELLFFSTKLYQSPATSGADERMNGCSVHQNSKIFRGKSSLTLASS